MHVDLAIRSKNILTPQGMREGILLIKDGVIADILPYADYSDGVVADAGELVVMPGVIDPHVHINEPGRADWEGFDTATRAAAAGGITTLIEMPLNASPVTTTKDNLNIKIDAAKDKLHVNCGFWGGVVPGNEDQLDELLKAGAFGLKAFLTDSGINDFPKSGLKELLKALHVLKKHDKPLLVHCELDDAVSGMVLETDPSSYHAYLQSRPKAWENNAIEMMITLCEEVRARVHIVHLSSAEALDMISKAKSKLPLTVETAQHYIYFNAEQIGDGQTQFKCAPPIREKENNEKLWEALRTGIIDFIATDHSPSPPLMKHIDTGSFAKAWGGIAGLQFSLPVVWTAAKERGASLKEVATWLCSNTADFLRLHKKGRIQKGADADLVIWDPEEEFVVTEDIIQHRHKLTPYINCRLKGVVKQTYLGGKLIYDRGIFNLNQGTVLLR